MLTFLDFQRKNDKRCIEGFKHKHSDWSLLEWCGAIAGEVGEACNKAKKLKRIDQNIKGNKAADNQTALTEDMAKEICDGIIYGFLTISAAGYDVEELIREVFNAKSDEIGSDIKI
jgi:NTP pyrophosphatase (non-canonical NTP hydrolase)